MNITDYMQAVGQQARSAAAVLAGADTATKNKALEAMAKAILAKSVWLKTENAKDLAAGREKGLDSAMLDRLTLS
ncbi:MAG: gamma-glutamyl-phosphate reductase, partial [Thiothrix sp.]